MISAITFIFSKEEAEFIEPCLQSLSFVDEIIVIDNGAPEEVLKIVKKYTKNIYQDFSKDFASRHNLGKEKASGDWLLYVDCDERVSKKLKDEILETLNNPKDDAYQLRRVNFFLGKEVKFGDRVPDYVTRLFKKEKLTGWFGEIHESSEVDGTKGILNAPLYHLTHRNIFSMVEKTINFSEHEADLRLKANHPPVVWWRLIRVLITEMFIRLIKMGGWRQGTEGWIDGLLQSFSIFIVYARLWEKQQKVSLYETYRKLDEDILGGKI